MDCFGACVSTSYPHASRHINPQYGERVILDFYPFTCCKSSSPGFSSYDIENVPPQLTAAGVKQYQWSDWLARYNRELQPHSNVCCFWTGMVSAWSLIIPGLIITLCVPLAKYSKYQKNFKSWLNTVNEELPKNCYVKAQTSITQQGRTRLEQSTISFAISQRESDVLKAEAVMVMDHDECECLICTMDKHRAV